MENIKKLKPYLANVILIWIAILIYHLTPYYSNFLRKETLTTLLILAIIYTIPGFFYHFYRKEKKNTTGLFFLQGLQNLSHLKKQEKTAMLFVLVKIFFLPIMLNFFYGNLFAVKNQIPNLISSGSLLTMNSFNNLLFPFLLSLIFLIDTTWFAFGYTFESKLLKNKIRSVDPTFIGWFVAIICYPPFNGFLGKYLNWYANDYVIFLGSIQITFFMRILIILLLGIYVSATIALGTKCSNLTNRGIVSIGPYSIIRHPAYISKNLAWWLTVLPVISIPAIISMGIWSTIYHFRTLTEERHLSKDPEYLKYKKKVKYKYIPRIY